MEFPSNSAGNPEHTLEEHDMESKAQRQETLGALWRDAWQLLSMEHFDIEDVRGHLVQRLLISAPAAKLTADRTTSHKARGVEPL